MSYFKHFPYVDYQFDNDTAVVQDITVYADIVDQFKDAGEFYQDYYIRDGERADNIAYKLYNNPQLHWLLYLMNGHIRLHGWPLSRTDLLAKVKADYPYTVLTTNSYIIDKLSIGQSITGNTTGSTGTIVGRNVQLGQLIVDVTKGSFTKERIVSQVGVNNEVADITGVSPQYLSTRHYVDGNGELIDINPYQQPPALANPITHYDFYIKTNDDQRHIRVLRPSAAQQVVSAYRKAVSR